MMPLTEEQAAKIVLVRSVEECSATIFTAEVLAGGLDAAKQESPGLRWVEKRASYLFDHLSAGYRSLLRLARLPDPWTVPAAFIVLLLGLATNLLGPAEKIHVVRNPVFILVTWNMLVYLSLIIVFVVRSIRKRRSRSDKRLNSAHAAAEYADQGDREESLIDGPGMPWSLRLIVPGLWRIVHDGRFGLGEARVRAGVIARFTANWFQVAGPLVIGRWKRLLHLGALFLAIGAVAGMYLRGLFQDYEVIWTSTFVRREETLTAIIRILFGPSLFLSDLLGLQLADEISVPRLFSSEGDKADAWIHLFALTVLVAVVIPRASLAVWQSLRIRKVRDRLGLPLDSYYGHVIEGPLRSAIEQAVETAGSGFAQDIAAFIGARLYDEQIVPTLRKFRRTGGRVVELKAELAKLSEAFLPELNNYIASVSVPELQLRISQRVGELVKSMGTDFRQLGRPDQVIADVKIPTAQRADLGVAANVTKAIGISIATAVSVALATIGGGIGHHLGIAIIATLLGTSGPVGFLIGLMAGAVVTAGAWLFGRERLTGAVENFPLPAIAVQAALWGSRFEKLLDDGRNQFTASAQENVTARLRVVMPAVTDQILARVRSLWAA
jgi:hypothetical protein